MFLMYYNIIIIITSFVPITRIYMLCPQQKIRDGGGRKNHPQLCRGCTPNIKTIKKRKKNMSNINLDRFVKLHRVRQEAGINC